MKKMKFNRPSFHKGANLTVRLGKKWNGYRGDIQLCDIENQILGEAIVVNTEKKRFCDLRREDIRIEHDPHCTDLGFLEEEMSRAYGDDFDTDAVVTLVTFVIDGGTLGTTTTFI